MTQRRVDRRSESARVELSGRVRPVERTADYRRDQERHQPVPRLGVRRRAQLRLELQQPDQHAQRRSEDDLEGSATGATRSAVRSASPAAATSCSSSTRQEFEPRTGGNNVMRFRVPTALERRATSRGRPTTTATRIRTQGSAPRAAPAPRPDRSRVSTTAACSAGFRRTALPDGPEHPEPVPDAEHRQRAGAAGLQLRADAARRESAGWQPAVRLDYQPTSTLRATFKYTGVAAKRSDA